MLLLSLITKRGSDMAAAETTVRVDYKSAWLSKINWTQAIAVVAGLLSYFGFDLDAQTQEAVLMGIVGIQAVVTWVLKTFFTSTVTPSSMPPGTITE